MEKIETLYYSTSELATMLGVARSTVIDRAREGDLPAIRFGRLWRFPKKKIDQWLTQEQPGAATEPEPKRVAHPVPAVGSSPLFQALALAEELDPVIEAGTLVESDVSEDLQALREERMRQIDGE